MGRDEAPCLISNGGRQSGRAFRDGAVHGSLDRGRGVERLAEPTQLFRAGMTQDRRPKPRLEPRQLERNVLTLLQSFALQPQGGERCGTAFKRVAQKLGDGHSLCAALDSGARPPDGIRGSVMPDASHQRRIDGSRNLIQQASRRLTIRQSPRLRRGRAAQKILHLQEVCHARLIQGISEACLQFLLGQTARGSGQIVEFVSDVRRCSIPRRALGDRPS